MFDSAPDTELANEEDTEYIVDTIEEDTEDKEFLNSVEMSAAEDELEDIVEFICTRLCVIASFTDAVVAASNWSYTSAIL